MTLDFVLVRLRRVRCSGNGYVALCPAHGDRTPSLSITQVGGRVLLHCFVGCSVDDVCEALDIRVRELFVPADSSSNSHWSDTERKEYALGIWRSSRSAAGTVVERYLANRGITIPIPRAIRFIPLRMHREYGWPFPVLAAGIQAADGAFAAVSLTWLSADGTHKAPVEPPRRIHGPYGGSAVRLAPAGESLVLCEGVETGLSIAQACPDLPVWCALSAKNLPHVTIPQSVDTVIIAADPDAAGEMAAQAAARRFLRGGRHVRIARTGRAGQDFNDLRL
ncbi:MAG TPA: toprim domain-containing protein [Candidatus Binataceae bacterium]|nr:toprim domain-containing protein [Candidatus Binataceae bacterium]